MKTIILFFFLVLFTVNAEVVLRFATISDGHWSTGTDRDFYNVEMFKWLEGQENGNGKSLAYVFSIGDMFFPNAATASEIVDSMESNLTMPFYFANGNHDALSDTEWESVVGYPKRSSFEFENYAFVIEDTRDYQCPDDNGAWLDATLDSYADKDYVFVFMHINPNSMHGYSIDCPGVVSALEGHPNVAGVYHGHDHGADDCMISNGVYYFWDAKFHYEMWFSPGYNYGYRIVEVNDDGTITSYQNNIQGFDSSIVMNSITYAMGPYEGILVNWELDNAVVDRDYNDTITAIDGTGPYSWSIISGSLPSGITMNGDGVVSGTIAAMPGEYAFAVQVQDANDSLGSRAFILKVLGENEINLANGSTRSSSSGSFSYGGELERLWDNDLSTGTESYSADSIWVEYDLGKVYSLSSTRFYGHAKGGYISTFYSVYAKLDESESYTTVVDNMGCNGPEWYEMPLSMDARYVRLKVVGDTSASTVGAKEFELYGDLPMVSAEYNCPKSRADVSLAVSPNPFNPSVKINLRECNRVIVNSETNNNGSVSGAEILVYNSKGKLMHQKLLHDYTINYYTLNADSWPTGTYIIKARTRERVLSKRITLIK